MKATHVRVIQSIHLVTGVGTQRREYGRWNQGEWIPLASPESVDLILSDAQVQAWAVSDGVEW